MIDLIVSDTRILGGKPCIQGTRLSVDFILELLASGASRQEILASYPQLTDEGLSAALEYAAATMRSELVWHGKVPA